MKQASRLMILIWILTLLAGCGLSDGVLRHYEGSAEDLLFGETREEAVLEIRPPLYSDAEPVLLWGRAQLTEHAREAYDQMSAAIAAYREEPLKVDADAEELPLILTALRIDHPEYFWFDGEASFVISSVANLAFRTECTFVYTMDRSEIQEAHQRIRQYTAACLSALETEGAVSDYDRILGVYRYIIRNTDYVISETDQSILSAMSRHRATCAGYARTFQYLMGQLDIPCTLAMGEIDSGESHGWNMVQCDGQWYQMDVTWGDPVDAAGNPGTGIQYTYCLVTDQEIYRDHTLICELPMPVCTADEDNYFIREGLQFDRWSPEAYIEAMTAAVAEERDSLDVRFSNKEAYDQAVYDLFQSEHIWDALQSAGAGEDLTRQVNYSIKDTHLEISVRLRSGGD